MSEAVLISLISSGFSLFGVIITVLASSSKTNATIKVNQAITDTKIEELTREVREHNGFARRVPVLEEQVKVINHRLTDIEKKET